MILIKDAISTGSWLHCEMFLGTIFRIRVLSFQKLNISEVDNPEKINLIDNNKTIWIMDLEVVNLSKDPIHTFEVTVILLLINLKGLRFLVYKDNHLGYYSEFSKKKKLNRFYGSSEMLNPKIKAIGAILFQLPDDDNAEYLISTRGGSIKEV